MRLCVDCKWMIHGWNCRLIPISNSNPVNGGFVSYASCSTTRKQGGYCGPDGKYWERAGWLKRWWNREAGKSD